VFAGLSGAGLKARRFVAHMRDGSLMQLPWARHQGSHVTSTSAHRTQLRHVEVSHFRFEAASL